MANKGNQTVRASASGRHHLKAKGRYGLVLTALLLVACGAGPTESRLQDYQARLQRTLQLELEAPSPPGLPRFPRPRELLAASAQDTIGLIELWSLRDCALHGLIAQKNSSLGRVALPSTQLFHELDFLRLLPACLQQLNASGNEALALQLSQVGTAKREDLPNIIWQALLGGQEYREYWNTPQQLPDYTAGMGAPGRSAAQALTRLAGAWLSGNYELDRGAVEEHLKQLGAGAGGALYKSLLLQQLYLDNLDAAMRVRLQVRPICYSAGDDTAPILDNVVRKYFIGEVQPWSVQLQRGAQQLHAVQSLEALLAPGEPEPFKVWRTRRNALIDAALGAPKRHVESLLPLLEQCGLAPGASIREPADYGGT
jgi:hypothetical protein